MTRMESILAPSSTAYHKDALLTLAFVLFAGLGLQGCHHPPEPLVITVLFYNAPALAPGDPVVYKSVRIGEITQVDAPKGPLSRHRIVEVHIDPENTALMYRQMAFTVDTIRLLKGQHKIVLMDRVVSSRIPVREGDVFIGTTYVQYVFGQANDFAIDVVQQLKRLLDVHPIPGAAGAPRRDNQRLDMLLERYLKQMQDSAVPDSAADPGPSLRIRVN